MFSSLADVLRDMRETAQAHEQWAMTPDASTSEAGTSTAFAAQIKKWLTALSESLALSASRTAPAPQQEGLDLAPIKARQKARSKIEHLHGSLCLTAVEGQQASNDCAELITEIERHRARIQVLETSVDYLRNLIDHPVTQERERWAVLLPEGVSALEAKSLTTGRLLSDADCFQWVKAVDVAAPPVAPAEGEQ